LIKNGSLPLSIVEWILLDDSSSLDQALNKQKISGPSLRNTSIAMQLNIWSARTQYSRVTFANGEWQGSIALNSGDTQAALDSCPEVGTIQSSGPARMAIDLHRNATITNEGQTSQVSYQLFLRRERMSDSSF